MVFISNSLSIKKAFSVSLLGLCSLIINACSTIPTSIADSPEASPAVTEVQAHPDSYTDQRVRWGGSIVSSRNVDGETIIQLVSRPLMESARPLKRDQTDGRFIARLSGFYDPKIYAPDRMLTVVGILKGTQLQKIGELDYVFPVVKVDSHHLWTAVKETNYPYGYYDPWFFSPYPYQYPYYNSFYSPFWPYYPHRPYRY